MFARFRAIKSIFDFNVYIGYFGRSHIIIKAVPHECARKLRLTRPSAPSAVDDPLNIPLLFPATQTMKTEQ